MSRSRLLVAVGAFAAAGAATSQSLPSPVADAALARVTIRGHYDNAVGTSDAASQGVIRGELLQSRPALRPGELLEFVPGVIVTQHSGDGKANQYFLRGFNLDHGTDFATSLDGMPVNMPTHGHGQGYTDLNPLIPELVDRIEYRKGPYFAHNGDFSSAGSADIVYRRRLDQPFAQVTLAPHGHRRLAAGGSTSVDADKSLLAAVEVMSNDGPWTLPERLKKANAVLGLSTGSSSRGGSASLMGYRARWTSTDQVPQRAIADGRIGRFDAIDASNGGDTSRTSVSGEWHDRSDDRGLRVSAHAMRYRLRLFSNFTYATRSAGGALSDQFEQTDSRTVLGLRAARDSSHTVFGRAARSELGIQLRHDRIRVGLFDTLARQRVATTRDDAVRETSLGLYGESSIAWTDHLRTVAGVRADRFRFHVDGVAATESGRATDTQLSPKLSVIVGPWRNTEVFVNAGRGFHSNDARGTTASVDPVPGVVSNQGWEIGARTEALAGLQSSLALWTLRSGSELVYVGDAGTTSATRASRRRGVEWNNRWIPLKWLLVDADLAWSRARFSDPDPAGDRIPGAVERVASVAVTLRDRGPWSGSLQWRYLGPRPLVEDGSVRAPSSLLTNLRVGYKLGPDAELTVDVFNVHDRKVNDIEYFYASQLPGEAAATPDRHVHPAEPRTLRVSVQFRF
jgi:hypothetical protein